MDATPSPAHSYETWEQLSGYFDGDGAPILTLTMFTVVPSIDWADSYRPQLEAVRSFLVGRGLKPTNTYPCGHPKPVWHLRLYDRGGVGIAGRAMLPLLVKKHDQIQAMIDYLENRMTGEALLEAFNEATRIGTRSGFIWDIKMPYTHAQGLAHARDMVHKGKRVSHILTKEVLADIRQRQKRGETLRDLSFVYGVSGSAIRRAELRLARGNSARARMKAEN